MKKIDVLIIGAGAAGLMCAIEAGQRGRKVLLIDHANKAGKKILMSGGGRCTFTNLAVSSENFISHNPQFCKSALSRYTHWYFIQWVQKSDIPYHEKTLGQLFCDNKSKEILNMLLQACEMAKVAIQLNTSVNNISKQSNNRFIINTGRGDFSCESLVIATGGLSIPTMGASPFGYRIAEQFDIKVWPTRAGLVAFTLHPKDKDTLAVLAGVSLDCLVNCNQQTFRESILFTHRGLSGPAMLQISSYWQPGDTLTIDLLPEVDLFELLKQAQQSSPQQSLRSVLSRYLPRRLVSVWLASELADINMQACTYKQLESAANLFKKWAVRPNSTEGYRTAEVTLGGVDCHAISSKTMQANAVDGLYFIGEVLDMTGWLGGYNFQWAWSTGYAAGLVV